MTTKRKNSRAKGCRGERDFAEFLRLYLNVAARRGVQYAGGPDSPDIVLDIPIHFEVKRAERLDVYKGMEQAIKDSRGFKVPALAWRKNNKEWLIVLRATDMLEFSKTISERSNT
jgi:hypothetical protein